MKHFLFCLAVLVIATPDVSAQAKVRRLSTSINHPSVNLYSPFISADANAMLFISDNTEDNILTPFYTVREATDWKEPQVLPKNIYTRLNFLRGNSLSADGKRIYFSTLKGPSVGGFDIFYSDWKNSAWGEPVNLGMPVNSKGNDACAVVTPDGNAMYFMRCEKMDQQTAGGCKIFRVNRKPNGQWEDAVELPANVNTGNSQAPRIMADGETLIFSSDKLSPNKGGMDLYVTRMQDGKWTNPVALDFVNTAKDDQYVGVAALGRYLLRDSPGTKKNELVEYLIPAELRPKGMMKVEGNVTDPAGQPVTAAYIAATDIRTNKKMFNSKPNTDGSFLLYVKEGAKYELTIDPEQSNITYFSKVFDLTTDKFPQAEKVNAILKSPAPGDELSLELVKFKPNSSQLDMTSSANELKRLSRLITANTSTKFEIQVLLNGYVEDSVQSDPDLTEVIYDSVLYQFEGLDSLGNTFTEDSVAVEATYHNNRTLAQAQAIVEQLASMGVNRDKLTIFGNAIPAVLPENKKLTVKAVVKK
jgi:hypothetical protein